MKTTPNNCIIGSCMEKLAKREAIPETVGLGDAEEKDEEGVEDEKRTD